MGLESLLSDALRVRHREAVDASRALLFSEDLKIVETASWATMHHGQNSEEVAAAVVRYLDANPNVVNAESAEARLSWLLPCPRSVAAGYWYLRILVAHGFSDRREVRDFVNACLVLMEEKMSTAFAGQEGPPDKRAWPEDAEGFKASMGEWRKWLARADKAKVDAAMARVFAAQRRETEPLRREGIERAIKERLKERQ